MPNCGYFDHFWNGSRTQSFFPAGLLEHTEYNGILFHIFCSHYSILTHTNAGIMENSILAN